MKQLLTKAKSIATMLMLLIFYNSYAQLPLVSNQNIDFSTAVSTTTSGNWSNPAIWSNGQVPNAATDVIINDGHAVYIDVQGSVSDEIVDLCRNIQVKPTAVLQMGHNIPSFAKDLRINGSILCNGTFSAGRNQPGATGDGSIYLYNSRIYLNLTQDQTFVSGSGFFNPRALNIASNSANKNLTIDLYNMIIDENFAIKSDNLVNATISHFAYMRVKGTLGLTGSTHQFSSPTAKANLTIHGIVVTNDVSLFTRNTTAGESSSITIENQGSLYTQKINNATTDKKTQAAGFTLAINTGGLLRLGKGVNFESLTLNNPKFTLNNSGKIREHYSKTLSTTAQITAAIDLRDPNKGADVKQIKDIFGATQIAGWYNSTSRPYLLEGLDFYKKFGATSVKTTLTAVNGKMYDAYPFNHTWPNFATLKDVAQHVFIDSLFKRQHIKTHTFWTTTKLQGEFRKGPDFNHANYLNEEKQFYDLTKHLLTTYGSMNKTFVYQNWEGDWMLRGEGVAWENDPTLIPDDIDWEIEGMARLFRARQRGTERARNEFSGVTAQVFYATEFNKLWTQKNGTFITMEENGTPSVLADVIPKIRLDLTSWSAYDGDWTDGNNPRGHAMWKGLEIARYFTTESGGLMSNCPVQIGEFGVNENPKYNTGVTESGIRTRYGRYIGVALGLGIPNFYLWNFYGSGQQGGPAGFTWQKGVQYDDAFLTEWLDGKWLIKPDGTWGFAAKFLMEQWATTLSTNTSLFSNNQIILYPNPAKDYIQLHGLNDNSQISIFDLNGRMLKKVPYSKNETIDVSILTNGTYILKIQDANKTLESKKLIIN